MAINTKVMLNVIKAELLKRGYTSRLLPKANADQLFNIFTQHGYQLIKDNVISNTNTEVTFKHTRNDKVKVMFKALV